VPSATDDVRRAIDAAGGAIRFDEFVSIALYGPHGFYTSAIPSRESTDASRTGRAGRRGDFLTSPEVGPLFGAVFARALDTWWTELGCPDPFVVVECGAGPGTLARTIFAARPRCGAALHYVAVEESAAQRALHPPNVTSRSDMPNDPFSGVIIANELLDNLPFRLFVFDGGWREAYVAHDGLRLVERLVVSPEVPASLPGVAAHGSRVAVHDAAREWVNDAVSLLNRGRLVVIDYCSNTTSMTTRPWREWLRTYVGHERGVHYLASVGEQDITLDVAVDQLPRPTSVSTQAAFLHAHGIEDLVAEGQAAWQRAASHPDLVALIMRSRIREAEALLDTSGLGSFSVLQWVVN